MDRRDFLQIIGTVIGGAVVATYLPPVPVADASGDGGYLVTEEFRDELMRVLYIDVEQDMVDVTLRGDAEPRYVPGLKSWHGEAELDPRAAQNREVMAWLRGDRPVPLSLDRGAYHIEGQALVTSFDAQLNPVRVHFQGSGALTANVR